MVNRRYFLVIIDSAGSAVKRSSVSRRALQLSLGALASLTVLTLALFTHGMFMRHEAREAATLARENEQLRQVYAQLQEGLPAARMQALQGELRFAQLWAKSGLGVQPKLLGVGPLDAYDLQGLTGDENTLAPPERSHVFDIDPVALPLELTRLESDGQALQRSVGELLEYFYDAALLLSNTPSVRPVEGAFLTSSFGKRKHPIYGGWVMHKGLDIGGRIGMEIFAPADGVVIFTGYRGGYGQTVVIDHGYGLQTHYAHLSKYRCRPGDKIRRGDVIAEMGNTGASTGPHLHYEVRRAGQPLNPTRFILD